MAASGLRDKTDWFAKTSAYNGLPRIKAFAHPLPSAYDDTLRVSCFGRLRAGRFRGR